MRDEEKTVENIFGKSVEALGLMTKALCDAIRSTKPEKRSQTFSIVLVKMCANGLQPCVSAGLKCTKFSLTTND